MSQLKHSIRSALVDCLKLKKGEKLLILTDETLHHLALQFYQAAVPLQCKAHFFILPMSTNTVHSKRLPDALAHLMSEMDVVIIMTSRSLSHTTARREACKKGARIISMPGIQEEVLLRTLPGNYKAILYESRKLADILTIGRSVHLTTPAGTDLHFSISRMKGKADTGLVHEAGQFSNLPAGEGCIGPVQGSANGIMVIDGSFPGVGLMNNGVRMTFKNGQVIRISGGAEAEVIRKMLKPYGKEGRTIAELGIGTNREAKITGCTLEDEKVRGTVHVGLGNNISFGGKNSVGCHFDCVLLKPTLTIDNKTIIKDGKLLV